MLGVVVMTDAGQYVRVYYSVVDDERFVTIIDNEAYFGTWTRLLMSADGVWPASADIPRWVKPEALQALVDAGIIDLVAGDRFRLHGLDKERERRSRAGRAGGFASGRARGTRTPVERSLNGRSAPRSTNKTNNTNLDEHRQDETSTRDEGDPREPSEPNARDNAKPADSPKNGADAPSPSTPGQIVRRWLTDHGASPPRSGWVHDTLNELTKVYGVAAVVAAWERAAPDVRTSKQFVQFAERSLSPNLNGTKPAKSNGGHGTDAAIRAFDHG